MPIDFSEAIHRPARVRLTSKPGYLSYKSARWCPTSGLQLHDQTPSAIDQVDNLAGVMMMKQAQLNDLILQSLEHELGGVHVYRTAIQ
jgi:hypothetical protein